MSAAPASPLAYKPEIQGLRAIAVSAVLAFHVWPGWVTGGYIGVDVFFVISGYLITGVLLRDFALSGSIDLGRFYARRIRRLLPAAAAVLIAIAVAIPLLPEVRWRTTGAEILASTLYVQNWWLAAQSVDYLASDDAPSVLLHFWSLSVEEQYYIAWPLVLLSVARLVPRMRAKPELAFGILIGLVFVSSLAYSVYLTPRNPGHAYFATTTRAWELALGGLLALWLGRAVLPAWLRESGTVLGTVLVGGAAFAYGEETPFPGIAALIPTIGAAAMIAGAGASSRLSLNRILASRPLQYVGDISYSLYLWHWPVVIFYSLLANRPLGMADGVIVVAISVALAHQTKDLIEDRFRFPRAHRRKGAALVAAASLGLSLAAGATVLMRAPVSEQVLPVVLRAEYPGAASLLSGEAVVPNVPYVPAMTAARADRSDAYGRCIVAPGETEPEICAYGDPNASVHIAIVGDSHAVHWFPALQALAEQNQWRVSGISKSACAFGAQPVANKAGAPMEDCAEWSRKALSLLLKLKPNLVISAQSIGHKAIGSINKDQSADKIGAGLAESWSQLVRSGSKVMVIKDTPWMSRNIPDCLSKPGATPADCSRPRSAAIDFRRDPLVVGATLSPEVTLVDVTNGVCGPEVCEPIVGNVLVWRDSHHLTATYAKTLAPYLKESIVAVLARSSGRAIVWQPGIIDMMVAGRSAPPVARQPVAVRTPASAATDQSVPSFTFPHTTLYERVGSTQQGGSQKQVFIAALGPSYHLLVQQVKEDMVNQGYRLEQEVPSRGGARLDFTLPGGQRWSAHVTGVEGRPRLVAKGGTGAVYLTAATPN